MLSPNERDKLKALVDFAVRCKNLSDGGKGAWQNEAGKDGECRPGDWMPTCFLPPTIRALARAHAA